MGAPHSLRAKGRVTAVALRPIMLWPETHYALAVPSPQPLLALSSPVLPQSLCTCCSWEEGSFSTGFRLLLSSFKCLLKCPCQGRPACRQRSLLSPA